MAIPGRSLWLYIFGWSLAGMGAQTEIVWLLTERSVSKDMHKVRLYILRER